ncbi:MAG TPA: hypothetical protein DEO33_03585 [Rikenellaceae bacterium]|nr:hypothetical protein [Rikenellaceae bacterium]
MIKFNSMTNEIQQSHNIENLSAADKMNILAWLIEDLGMQEELVEGISFKKAFKEKVAEIFK